MKGATARVTCATAKSSLDTPDDDGLQYSPGWPGVHTDDTDGDDGLHVQYSPGWPGVQTDDTCRVLNTLGM